LPLERLPLLLIPLREREIAGRVRENADIKKTRTTIRQTKQRQKE